MLWRSHVILTIPQRSRFKMESSYSRLNENLLKKVDSANGGLYDMKYEEYNKMKIRTRILGLFLTILMGFASASNVVHADVDWTAIREIKLGARPLDVAASPDGTLIFILSPSEIHVYSVSKNKVVNRIPITKDFDRLTYSIKNNALVLTSSSLNILKIIRVDRIQEIDISGLPFKGPENAPVTIAVFDDYQ